MVLSYCFSEEVMSALRITQMRKTEGKHALVYGCVGCLYLYEFISRMKSYFSGSNERKQGYSSLEGTSENMKRSKNFLQQRSKNFIIKCLESWENFSE